MEPRSVRGPGPGIWARLFCCVVWSAAEDPEDVDSDFDNDSDDSDLPNYLPTYCDSESEHDIPNKYGDINFDLIRPPGGSLTAYYDRLGRVREVPAGFGIAREALVEALKVNGEDRKFYEACVENLEDLGIDNLQRC